MEKYILSICLLVSISMYSQAPQADELITVHNVTSIEMNNIVNPTEGSLVYNSTDRSMYQRTNNEWVSLSKQGRTYIGHFIITATGDKIITGIPFEPSQISFKAYANIESENINADNQVGNNNTSIANSFGNMTGYARGTTQQVIYVGGSGNSINDISRYSSSTHCIGIRYGNQNGDNLGITSASFTSFDANGFTLNVDSKADNLVVIYTAYE